LVSIRGQIGECVAVESPETNLGEKGLSIVKFSDDCTVPVVFEVKKSRKFLKQVFVEKFLEKFIFGHDFFLVEKKDPGDEDILLDFLCFLNNVLY
jgi:hypothetical protein